MTDDVQRSLGRIEGKLDALNQTMASYSQRADKTESRVSKIENRQYWYAGASAVLGTIVGFFLNPIR